MKRRNFLSSFVVAILAIVTAIKPKSGHAATSPTTGFDEEGRRAALRDMLASLPGVSAEDASKYVLPYPSGRARIAELEIKLHRQGWITSLIRL